MAKSYEKIMERRTFKEGSFIFKEGQPGDSAFIIENGEVNIFKKVAEHDVHLSTLRKGALFGEMAVISGGDRMATAKAATHCTLVRIPAHMMREKMQKLDPFMRALLNMLMDNLREVHEAYAAHPRSLASCVKQLEQGAEDVHHSLEEIAKDEMAQEAEACLGQLRGAIEQLEGLSSRLMRD